jgi:MFS transporter, DHA1 family, tetracycline resistance protein
VAATIHPNPEVRALPLVLSTIFLDCVGVGILFPILPQLVFKIFIPQGFSETGAYVVLGWLIGVYPLMQFLFTPILGQFSDRFGRKPVLAFCLAGTGVGYALFAIGLISKDIPLIFVARALAGASGGNISVTRAVVADVSVAERRTRNFGLMGAAFGMGFVMGPFLGARLSIAHASFFGLFHMPGWLDISTPFWFASGLGVINTLLLLGILPETNKHISRGAKVVWTSSLSNIRKAASAPGLSTIFSAEFLFWGGFAFFTTFLPLQLIEKYHFSATDVGNFFAYIGICIALVQGALIPLIEKRFKNHQVVRLALFGMAGALALQALSHHTAEVLVIGAVIALFFSVFMTNASALVSSSASASIQGEVLGIEASVQALGEAIPPIIAGYVASLGIIVPNVVGAIVVFVGGVLFLLLYRSGVHVSGRETSSVVREGLID